MAADNGDEARKARLDHNRRLVTRAKFLASNVEAIAVAAATMASEGVRKTDDETKMKEDLAVIEAKTDVDDETKMKEDLVVMEAKTEIDEAKISNDAKEEKKVEARIEELPKEEKKVEARGELPKEEKKALNAEGNKKENSQASSKKAEAKRKEGYNKFSLLFGIVVEAATTTEGREERAVEAAITTEETKDDDESEYETEQEDVEGDKRVEQALFDAKNSEMQDLVAKIAEEAAAAENKREKRKRKKKTKAEKPNGTKAEKPNGSYQSIGVLCLAFVCILVYSFT